MKAQKQQKTVTQLHTHRIACSDSYHSNPRLNAASGTRQGTGKG